MNASQFVRHLESLDRDARKHASRRGGRYFPPAIMVNGRATDVKSAVRMAREAERAERAAARLKPPRDQDESGRAKTGRQLLREAHRAGLRDNPDVKLAAGLLALAEKFRRMRGG
jgi:hypothetical protein